MTAPSAGTGSRMMQYDYLVKTLLIGDSGVGKSSLLIKFTDDKFSPNLSQTIGMDFKVKMLDIGGKRIKLQIWDTAGQERYHTITQQYYRNAMGIILVYDATSEESFANIRRWAAQIAAHGGEGTNRILLGNKADCDPARRAIDPARGQALADEFGITFMETSAKSGLNVEQAFVSIADAVRLRLQNADGLSPNGSQQSTNSRIHLSQAGASHASGSAQAERQRKGCCGSGG